MAMRDHVHGTSYEPTGYNENGETFGGVQDDSLYTACLETADPRYDSADDALSNDRVYGHACCGCYCDHTPACPPCECAFHNPNVE